MSRNELTPAHPTTAARDLYEAILREPACDLVRLAYADEVDGRGDNRLAEFIRLQIRIAEIERECSCGACVKLRGGGQHTNGPCAVSRERDEMPDGTSKNAMLRLKESNLLDFGFDEIPAGVKLTYRRGFVDSVAMTMRAFMGGECERCDGRGVKAGNIPARICLRCNGTGRIPGLVDTIGKLWPITRVTLTDREPWVGIDNSDRFKPSYWWVHGGERYDEERYFLPEELWSLVAGGPAGRRIANTYPIPASALAALSDAAVSLLRERAGLPPLKWRTDADNPRLDGPADRPIHAGNRPNDRLAGAELSQ